ncbi:Cysteine desulfurase [Fulvivirga imtechensis AK7]|uniref:Cysteine desulfurase n=1 Tax=Fulvivirga imtechensis AK7 TaxID=1237149 RepID=L8JU34_9BACT|nr:aminotransferase class V-fold PLP-dependent enzyme [Fulvivirga imtechensis]ELR71064.1 Cysteine desulfurase [Fulvivirga imtechensis AK7]
MEVQQLLKNQSEKFNLPDNQIYLNCAYMSPMLKSVEEAGIAGIRRKRNPASVAPEDFFSETEILRQEFGKLIGTEEYQRIVVIPSVSYGIASVTNNIDIKPGESIITMGEQFPSNYYPWKNLCERSGATLKAIKAPDTFQNRGRLWNQKILDAIDSNTKVVAMAHVHWADGTLFDLKAIREKTHSVGALLVIDGTQSIGALPFDIKEIAPDALICAGYKWLFGPYSIGLAYYGKYFDYGKPIEENWINRADSEDFASLVSYQDAYQPGALRYEVGEHSNFILVPMMLEALKQINAWKPSNIQEYCASITAQALKRLNDSNFIVEDSRYRGEHLFGIRAKAGINQQRLKTLLARENILVSVRGDAVRVAPHLYNTSDDMERLIDGLLQL